MNLDWMTEQRHLLDSSDQSVETRNQRQNCGFLHPLTCGNGRHDESHTAYQNEHGGDFGQLVAVDGGWICPVCDWTQDLDLRLIQREQLTDSSNG